MAPDAVQLHEKKPGNLERDVLFELGSVADGFAAGRPGARGHLQLRRGVPEPDGDARGRRRLRRGARPPHRACLHPGALLRAHDAGADPRHGHVAHPRRQAVRRRRLRLPHRDAQRRADRRAAGAPGRRGRAHHAHPRGHLHHAPRPARDRHPHEDRPRPGRQDHRGGMRVHPARRRALGLRRGDDPLLGLDAVRHLRPAQRQVRRQARADQHAAVRRLPRPRHGRCALCLREPARPDGGRDGTRPACGAARQPAEGAHLHRQRPDGEQLRPARVHRLGRARERLGGAQGQASQRQRPGLCLLALHLGRLQAGELDRRAARHREAETGFRRLHRRADRRRRHRPGLLHRTGADGGGGAGPRHRPRAHRLGRQRRGAEGQRLLFLARDVHRRQRGHRRGQQAQGPAGRGRRAQARRRARRHRVPGRALPRRRPGQGPHLRGGGDRGAQGRRHHHRHGHLFDDPGIARRQEVSRRGHRRHHGLQLLGAGSRGDGRRGDRRGQRRQGVGGARLRQSAEPPQRRGSGAGLRVDGHGPGHERGDRLPRRPAVDRQHARLPRAHHPGTRRPSRSASSRATTRTGRSAPRRRARARWRPSCRHSPMPSPTPRGCASTICRSRPTACSRLSRDASAARPGSAAETT